MVRRWRAGPGRQHPESWADLPRDCARRGMRAPVLAIGDGALGCWNALREVFPATREGRCWFHKTGNGAATLVFQYLAEAGRPAPAGAAELPVFSAANSKASRLTGKGRSTGQPVGAFASRVLTSALRLRYEGAEVVVRSRGAAGRLAGRRWPIKRSLARHGEAALDAAARRR